METEYISPLSPIMRPIIEEEENESDHNSVIRELDNTNITSSNFKKSTNNKSPIYNSPKMLNSIRSFIRNFQSSDSSFLSLLLYIKQLNESVSDLLNYRTFTSNQDSHQILLFLNHFNQNIMAYLNNINKQHNTKNIKFSDLSNISSTTNHIISPDSNKKSLPQQSGYIIPYDDDHKNITNNERDEGINA